MIEENTRTFLCKVTASFQSERTCTDVIVYKDTIITFKVTLPGTFFVQVHFAPRYDIEGRQSNDANHGNDECDNTKHGYDGR